MAYANAFAVMASSLSSAEFKKAVNGFKRAKMFANKATDEGGNKIIVAIDKLSATYNTA